jgi:hypothetical protein
MCGVPKTMCQSLRTSHFCARCILTVIILVLNIPRNREYFMFSNRLLEYTTTVERYFCQNQNFNSRDSNMNVWDQNLSLRHDTKGMCESTATDKQCVLCTSLQRCAFGRKPLYFFVTIESPLFSFLARRPSPRGNTHKRITTSNSNQLAYKRLCIHSINIPLCK